MIPSMFNVSLVILGGGGHSCEIIDLIEDLHYRLPYNRLGIKIKGVIVPAAKAKPGDLISSYTVLGDDAWLEEYLISSTGSKKHNAVDGLVLGIGDPKIRKRLVGRFDKYTAIYFPTLIHHSVAYDVEKIKLSEGVIISKNVSLTVGIQLDKHVQLNTACTVCHDVKIGEYTIVSPGAIICGNVTIGTCCFIGAGAVIKDGVKVSNDVVVGAGAVVIKDIIKPGTYVGVPAKQI